MSLYTGSTRDIVEALNRTTNVAIDRDYLIFGKTAPVDDAGVEVKVRITMDESYIYRGSDVFTYSRLRLEDLPGNLTVTPRLPFRETLYELLPLIKSFVGISFSEDDVLDAPVVTHASGDYRVQMVARDPAHGWTGSCEFAFTDLPPLSLILTETNISW